MAKGKDGVMSIPKDLIKEHKALSDWNIITAYRGSISHGMFMPNNDPNSIDDKDAIAICIPPIEYYFGLKTYGSRGTKEIKRDEWDIVIYEFKKFISLLLKGNPNVLSLLWLEDIYYINVTEIGQKIIDNKHLFIGKHVYHSFVGYAKGQMHRMTHGACMGYMGEKRKKLVEKYGYDTKNASHLIRLLRMAIEFLNEGKLYVQRNSDATELLDIKKGKWTLEKIKSEADRLFKLADESYVKSSLPNELDKQMINQFMCGLMEQYFGME